MTQQHETREQWLAAATALLDKRVFAPLGREVPLVRASVGWPGTTSPRVGGVCYCSSHSADEAHEIFISPLLSAPMEVLNIHVHELIHAVVGIAEKHGGQFRVLAKEIGLAGKMTATRLEEGTEIHATITEIAEELGPYPHAAMVLKKTPSKLNLWVRYSSASPGHEKYTVVVNARQVLEHGTPRDPRGAEMVASEKALAVMELLVEEKKEENAWDSTI